MTTLYGLAADNVLEFEVLTAAGEYQVANADTNPDLFWALAGGGPSAYAVILSTTFRSFEDVPSTGAILNINSTHTTNETLFWEAVTIFHSHANYLVDNGLYVYWDVFAGGLNVQPFVAINQTSEQLNALLQPMFNDFEAIGLAYDAVTKSFDTLFDLYIDLFTDEEAGLSALTGGWMFTHQDVATNNDGIIAAFKNVVDNGGYLVGHLWNPGYGVPIPRTATNPRFRNATDFVIVGLSVDTNATWDEKQAAQDFMTNNLDQQVREAGPNGCGYVNEVRLNLNHFYSVTTLHEFVPLPPRACTCR